MYYGLKQILFLNKSQPIRTKYENNLSQKINIFSLRGAINRTMTRILMQLH